MICSQCNKEFTPTHGRQKYCSEECIKSKATDYRTKYRQTDKGKEAVKKYNQSDTKKKYDKTDKNREAKKIYLKKYKQTDKGKADRIKYFQSDAHKAYQKKYRKEYAKTHQLSDKAKAYQSTYQKERKKSDPIFKLKLNARMNAYRKKRIKSDPIFKLVVNARTRLNVVLKTKNIKKMNSTIELFGCTPKFLKEYLEKQFYPHPITNEKMTWQNHTLHGWHVDHIDPLDLAMIPEDVVVLAHYTNLQPMWATENMKKGNKIF